MTENPSRSIRHAVRRDAVLAARAAAVGVSAFALVEYPLTLWRYAGDVPVLAKIAAVLTGHGATPLRFLALTVTLSLVAWLVATAVLTGLSLLVRAAVLPSPVRAPAWCWPLAIVLAGAAFFQSAISIAARFKEPQLTAALIAVVGVMTLPLVRLVGGLLLRVARPNALRPAYPGLLAPGRGGGADGPPVFFAGLLLTAMAMVGLQRLAFFSLRLFDSHEAAAGLIAGSTLLIMAVVRRAAGGFARALRSCADLVSRKLSRFSPLNNWPAALTLLYGSVGVAVAVGYASSPTLRAVLTENGRIRRLLALAVFSLGVLISLGIPRPRMTAARTTRRRRASLLVGAAVAVVVPCTLLWWGADAEAKYIAVSSSPPLTTLVEWVRTTNDVDRDGYGSWLGENDCAPFDGSINPLAREIADDGIDQNCDGRDFSLHELTQPSGGGAPVPEQFKLPWNVLLITIDTVRYDHTTMGGYATGPRARNTTPHLAELAARGTSFSFAQSPSAGTMASVPAIMTSKFFHSGIALGPERRGTAPKVLPSNVLIGEVMKRGGYNTGAITTHPYFNDWGLDQGIDSYDNSIGRTDDPYRISSQAVTDSALAFVAKQRGEKWFLWTHYIDPHGRYVAHPDGPDYGSTEEDLYDQELHYTDKHIGRLLSELSRMPGNENTIVVITSDHGDGFGEHGFINHGQALYRELIHVPLIVYVPNTVPRVVGGAVSGLDVLPTIAELADIDISDLSVEGKSLVPQIFYGTEEPERMVFAETNWPQPLRAVISASHKLIYNLKSNVYELYDLTRDPWEKTNLANKDPAAKATYKTAMDNWLARVLYSRDAATSQAASRAAELLLKTRPTPTVASPGVTFDQGKLAVLGIGLMPSKAPAKPGGEITVEVYFEVLKPPTASLRFGIEVLPIEAQTYNSATSWQGAARVGARITLEGLFPSEQWHPGEFVREQFKLKLPKTAAGNALAVALTVSRSGGGAIGITQADGSVASGRIILGQLPWAGPAVPPPATPPGMPAKVAP